jgi:hypothetical protein
MFKKDFNGVGIQFLCEHCRRIVASNFNFFTQKPDWVRLESTKFSRGFGGNGRGRILDFCSDRCRIIYLRGRKYWKRKQDHRENNGCIREA